MEAMAAGLPVVATQVGGTSELIEDGINGYLVPPGDRDTFVERVNSLLLDPEKQKRFGKAGRDRVRREFNVEREAVWLRHIMTEAMAGRTAPVRSAVDHINVEGAMRGREIPCIGAVG